MNEQELEAFDRIKGIRQNGSSQAMWEDSFVSDCHLLRNNLKDMNDIAIARLLEWLIEGYVHYVSHIVDLNDAVLKEAAVRLGSDRI
jgi:hypothetical protein